MRRFLAFSGFAAVVAGTSTSSALPRACESYDLQCYPKTTCTAKTTTNSAVQPGSIVFRKGQPSDLATLAMRDGLHLNWAYHMGIAATPWIIRHSTAGNPFDDRTALEMWPGFDNRDGYVRIGADVFGHLGPGDSIATLQDWSSRSNSTEAWYFVPKAGMAQTAATVANAFTPWSSTNPQARRAPVFRGVAGIWDGQVHDDASPTVMPPQYIGGLTPQLEIWASPALTVTANTSTGTFTIFAGSYYKNGSLTPDPSDVYDDGSPRTYALVKYPNGDYQYQKRPVLLSSQTGPGAISITAGAAGITNPAGQFEVDQTPAPIGAALYNSYKSTVKIRYIPGGYAYWYSFYGFTNFDAAAQGGRTMCSGLVYALWDRVAQGQSGFKQWDFTPSDRLARGTDLFNTLEPHINARIDDAFPLFFGSDTIPWAITNQVVNNFANGASANFLPYEGSTATYGTWKDPGWGRSVGPDEIWEQIVPGSGTQNPYFGYDRFPAANTAYDSQRQDLYGAITTSTTTTCTTGQVCQKVCTN